MKKGDFAKGLNMMATKGIIGAPIRLTKHRAQILNDKIIPEAISNVSIFYDDGDSSDEYLAACNWVLQQIQKRWSKFELYTDVKKLKS